MSLKNLLFYRLVIFNVLGGCVLIMAYGMGIIDTLLSHDALGVVYGIGGLLSLGVIGSLMRGWKVSQMLNTIKANTKYVNPTDVRKMPHKNEYIRDMAGWSVLLGLLGNVLGLIVALSGGEEALLAGVGTAFGSTAAGILVALWLEINFTMIRTATGLAIEEVAE